MAVIVLGRLDSSTLQRGVEYCLGNGIPHRYEGNVEDTGRVAFTSAICSIELSARYVDSLADRGLLELATGVLG